MRWLPSQRQMETFENGTLGSGGKFVHFFFRFLFLVILYSVWLIEQNHYLQLFLHLGYKVVCASQRASWAIAAETRGLKCCQLCQSDDWNRATSLDNVWLNVWSAVIEYLVNLSFLVACTGLFFFFSLWYLLSLFIYVFSAKAHSSRIRTCFIRPFKGPL